MKLMLKIELDMETGATIIDGPLDDEFAFMGLLGLAHLSMIETRAKKGNQAKLKSKLEVAPGPLPIWARKKM